MKVGDPCFAHVRSYPWWPAKVTSKSQHKDVFHVEFYGTRETASLPLKELAPITQHSLSKYCNSKILKRKYYKEGVEQMKAEYSWIVIPDHKASMSSASNIGKKFKTNRAVSDKQLPSKHITEVVGIVTPLSEIDINTGEVEQSSKVVENDADKAKVDKNFDWGEFEPLYVANKVLKKRDYFASRVAKSYMCDDCEESFTLSESRDLHMLAAHRDSNEVEAGDNEGSDKMTVTDAVAVKTKSKIKSKPALPRIVKTLREDEVNGNKAFTDKIEVKDAFFYCKSCSEFSTASKLKARCHALSCGKKNPKTRIRKLSPCLLCEEIFKNKSLLHLHNKTFHPSQSYTCSTCGKKFTMRQNYKRHIAIHAGKTELVCPVAQCRKTFNRKSNLTRHKKKMHKQQNKESGEGLSGASLQFSSFVDQQLNHGFLGGEVLYQHPDPDPSPALPPIMYELSSFEQVQSGSDIVINCNFVEEATGTEGYGINNNEEIYNDEIVMDEEHENLAFIDDIISEVVESAISAKIPSPTTDTGLSNNNRVLTTTGFPTTQAWLNPSHCYDSRSWSGGVLVGSVAHIPENTASSSSCSYGINVKDKPSKILGVQPSAELTESPPSTIAMHPLTQESYFLQTPYQFQEFLNTNFFNSSTVVSVPLPLGVSDSDPNSSSSVCSVTSVTDEAAAINKISVQNYNNEERSESAPRSEWKVNREGKDRRSEGNVRREGKASSSGYKCTHCGIEGILGPSKLKLHIDRMHSSPVVCKICAVTFEDKYRFAVHYPMCFYFCTQPGCNFHDKRKERFAGHMRRHEND